MIGIAAASVSGVAWLVIELGWTPRYDVSHPNYADIERQLRKASLAMDAQVAPDPNPNLVVSIDLRALNGADWTLACFFGGDSSPTKVMDERGATISEADRQRFLESSKRGFRFAEIAERESVLAFVDRNNLAHFLHFPISFDLWGPGLQACTTTPDHVIRLW